MWSFQKVNFATAFNALKKTNFAICVFKLNFIRHTVPVSPDRSYNFTCVSSFVRPLVKSFSENWLISFSNFLNGVKAP